MSTPWIPAAAVATPARRWFDLSEEPVSWWWNGSGLQQTEALGWWDGSTVQPAELLGWWDGAALQSLT